MDFRKYEGLGNDFIVVEASAVERPLEAGVVRRLCDRRRGVGADGVLVVAPGRAAPAAMTVHNADGSLAEMCGNGLRCVARFAVDHLGVAGPTFVVETGAGPRRVTVGADDVRAEMGAARDLGPRPAEAGGRTFTGHGADLGNPHLVLRGDWAPDDVRTLGPLLERHPAFARGVNVSFARPRHERHVELAVWERGSGATLACGTGACATVAVGWWEGWLAGGGEVRVDLPGGTLFIGGEPGALTMRGTAVEVYRGTIDLAGLTTGP
jgi:diaminopimelate epimerase